MASRNFNLLIVDDEGFHRDELERALRRKQCSVRVAARLEAALELLRSDRFELAVVEPNLREGSWFRLLQSLREVAPNLPLAVVSDFLSSSLVVAAAELGAIVTLPKPVSAERILGLLSDDPRALRSSIELSAESSDASIVNQSLAHVEWEHINRVLHSCEGNMAKAARNLGITRQSLYNKLRKAPAVRQPSARPTSK